jgi:outer membrane protein TolC
VSVFSIVTNSSGANVKSKFVISLLVIVASAGTAAAQDPSEPLTLQRVVDAYIAKNLELQAAEHRLERTRADQIAARFRLNPGLTITAENLKINGPALPLNRLYEFAASYSETIELGGKRKLRQSVADLTVSAAEAQFADTMRRGIAEVKRLYFDALLARYSIDIAVENRQTFEQLVQFKTFRNELLNEADESRSIALAAYQEVATQLLPVLDAQRTRSEVRQQYFRTLFDYQVSLIDLELAVGKELP